MSAEAVEAPAVGVLARIMDWLERRRSRGELSRLVSSLQWRQSEDRGICHQEWASVPARLGEGILLAGWADEGGEVFYYLRFKGDQGCLMCCTCCDHGNEGDLLAVRLVSKAAEIAATTASAR